MDYPFKCDKVYEQRVISMGGAFLWGKVDASEIQSKFIERKYAIFIFISFTRQRGYLPISSRKIKKVYNKNVENDLKIQYVYI